MRKILGKEFFNRETKVVAKDLLGKFLVRKIGAKEISVMIIETEAYDGLRDRASHAFKGRTKRTEVMFGHPRVFYVYLCYGMYYMLNVVTREYDYPAAVLVRGIIGEGVALHGPGKVAKFLNIDKQLNCLEAGRAAGLWFEDRGTKIKEHQIIKRARVGVAYAGPTWSLKKLRFVWQQR